MELFYRILLAIVLLYSLFVTSVTSSGCSSDVTVSCQSCDNKTKWGAIVGDDLIVRITLNNDQFKLIDISVRREGEEATTAGPENVIAMSIDTLKVGKGLSRFSTSSSEPQKDGKTVGVNITLKGLTLQDNGTVFSYKYRNNKLQTYNCDEAGTLQVSELKTQGSKRSIQDSPNIANNATINGLSLILLYFIAQIVILN